jgi:hypothetical protein
MRIPIGDIELRLELVDYPHRAIRERDGGAPKARSC